MILLMNFLLSTVVYAALSSTLQITGKATFRVESNIRIKGITVGSQEGSGTKDGALIQYEPVYTKETITTGFILPNSTSEITYKIVVDNRGDRDQTIYDFVVESTNNENIVYEIKEYQEKDIINFKTEKVFYITFKTIEPSNQVVNLRMKFNFREVYYITYETKGGTPQIGSQVKYQNEDIKLTEETIEKVGYTFNGWKANELDYKPGDIYKTNEDVIMYANLSANKYELTLDNQNSTITGSEKIYIKFDDGFYLDKNLTEKMTKGENPITSPTKSGDVFRGYYTEKNGKGIQIIDENGYITENIGNNIYTENATIYASWIDSVVPTSSIVATKKNSGVEVATNTWSSEGLNFRIMEETIGSSGATMYYCKDENNTCDPKTKITSGEVITSYNNLEQNEYYIRYKIVSGEGLTSEIKSYKARVDNIVPIFTMRPADGKGDNVDDTTLVNAYNFEDSRRIYYSEVDNGIKDDNGTEVTIPTDKLPKFGISGGDVVCYNRSSGSSNGIRRFNQINQLGNITVECIATSNANLSYSNTVIYKMSRVIDLDLKEVGIYPDTPENYNEAKKVSGQVKLKPGIRQFGPYAPTQKGCYMVVYNGTNVRLGKVSAIYNASNGNLNRVYLEILNPETSNEGSINYYIQLDKDVADLEVKMDNETTNSIITITRIKIMYLDEVCNFKK